jgi:hypothetical protein
MPITTREWVRGSPVLGPFLQSVWNPVSGGIGNPYNGVPWTLLYTYAQLSVTVYVPTGAGLGHGWWANSQVRLGLKFSPDGTAPGMATNDTSEDVLAIQSLYPDFVTGDVAGGGAHTVSWSQKESLKIETRRRNPPNPLQVVYPFIWATDLSGAFTGLGGAVVNAPLEIGCLWGQ